MLHQYLNRQGKLLRRAGGVENRLMARGPVRVVFRILAVRPDKVAELAGNGGKHVGVVGARLQIGTLGGAGSGAGGYAAGHAVLLDDEGADHAAYGADRVYV